MIYKNMFWRKKFFRFLKEESAYGKWVYNLNKKLNDESTSKDYLSTFVLNERINAKMLLILHLFGQQQGKDMIFGKTLITDGLLY